MLLFNFEKHFLTKRFICLHPNTFNWNLPRCKRKWWDCPSTSRQKWVHNTSRIYAVWLKNKIKRNTHLYIWGFSLLKWKKKDVMSNILDMTFNKAKLLSEVSYCRYGAFMSWPPTTLTLGQSKLGQRVLWLNKATKVLLLYLKRI